MSPPQDEETAHWFETQVQPFELELRNYLRGITAPDNIDDVVQETYFRLLRARSEQPVVHPRGLLFAIARNAAHDIFRRGKVAQTTAIAEFAELNVLDDTQDTPEAVCLHQEADLLDRAIQSLPDRCRTVLILRKFHFLSHREIADRMGITVHTVEAQLTNALKRCEHFFEKHGALAKDRRRKPAP